MTRHLVLLTCLVSLLGCQPDATAEKTKTKTKTTELAEKSSSDEDDQDEDAYEDDDDALEPPVVSTASATNPPTKTRKTKKKKKDLAVLDLVEKGVEVDKVNTSIGAPTDLSAPTPDFEPPARKTRKTRRPTKTTRPGRTNTGKTVSKADASAQFVEWLSDATAKNLDQLASRRNGVHPDTVKSTISQLVARGSEAAKRDGLSKSEISKLVRTWKKKSLPKLTKGFNEKQAAALMKFITSGQAGFRAQDLDRNGKRDYAPTWSVLIKHKQAPSWLKKGVAFGYRFQLQAVWDLQSARWMATASPVQRYRTGDRYFVTNHQGRVYAAKTKVAMTQSCEIPRGAKPVP